MPNSLGGMGGGMGGLGAGLGSAAHPKSLKKLVLFGSGGIAIILGLQFASNGFGFELFYNLTLDSNLMGGILGLAAVVSGSYTIFKAIKSSKDDGMGGLGNV